MTINKNELHIPLIVCQSRIRIIIIEKKYRDPHSDYRNDKQQQLVIAILRGLLVH